MIEFIFDDSNFRSYINGAIAKLDNVSDFNLMLSGYLSDVVETAFEKERDPVTHEKWKPLSERRIKERKGNAHPILQDTGLLAGSINPFSNESMAGIGTSVDYAVVHQFGKGKVPMRRFIGISDDDKNEIVSVGEKWFFG